MSGNDGELGSRDGKVRWRGGVSDAEVNEGCVVREESEDIGSEGRAEVGGFDLSRSTKLLNERSEMSNKTVVTETSQIFEDGQERKWCKDYRCKWEEKV